MMENHKGFVFIEHQQSFWWVIVLCLVFLPLSMSCMPSRWVRHQQNCLSGLEKDCTQLYETFWKQNPPRRMRLLYAEELLEPVEKPVSSADARQICRVMKEMCDERSRKACFAWGRCLHRGWGVKRNINQAIAIFRRTCDLKHPAACMLAAALKRQQLEEGPGPRENTFLLPDAWRLPRYHRKKKKNKKKVPPRRRRPAPRRRRPATRAAPTSLARTSPVSKRPARRKAPQLPKSTQAPPALLASQHPKYRKAWSEINGLFQQACALKHLDGCTAMGVSYELGRGIPVMLERAFATYLRACRLKNGWGCLLLGEFYEQGFFVSKDPQKARLAYGEACLYGDGRGCTALGDVYRFGRGVRPSTGRAAALYEKGCRLRSGRGCYALSKTLRRTSSVLKDQTYPRLLARRGCRLGHLSACVSHAGDLRKGRGFRKQPKLAWALVARGCALKHRWSCLIKALYYEKGIGVSTQPKKAFTLRKALCDKGYMHACHVLGLSFLPDNYINYMVSMLSAEDVRKSLYFLSMACQKKYLRSCFMGVFPKIWLMYHNKKSKKKRCEVIQKELDRVCARGYRKACYYRCRGGWVRRTRKRRRAVPL